MEFRSIPASALLLAFIAPALPASAEAEAGNLVQASLIADHSSVRAGSQFVVGVHFQIRPRWHIYWRNPGASGLPTDVRFQVPAGVTVGPLRWPVPKKFDQGEGLLGYGYDREVLLTAPVRIDRNYPADRPLVIRAAARWLACRESCVAGEKTLRLTLPPGPSKPGRESGLFARWRQRLPVPARGSTSPIRSLRELPRGTGGRWHIAVEWKQAPREVDWYPAGGTAVEISAIEIESRKAATTISYSAAIYSAKDLPEDGRIPGVIVYHDAEGVRHGLQVAMRVAPAGNIPGR